MDPVAKQERFDRRLRDMNRRALAAVERLLAGGDGSFAQVTIDQLVAELGISRATLYAYYDDKNDVLRVLAEDLLHTLVQTAGGWLDRDDGLTPDDLRAALESTMRLYVEHQVVLLAIAEVASYDTAMGDRYEAMLSGADAALVRHIELGQRRGFVDPDLEPATTGTWLTRMIWAGMRRFLVADERVDVDAYIGAITRIVWNTLYAPVAPSRA